MWELLKSIDLSALFDTLNSLTPEFIYLLNNYLAIAVSRLD